MLCPKCLVGVTPTTVIDNDQINVECDVAGVDFSSLTLVGSEMTLLQVCPECDTYLARCRIEPQEALPEDEVAAHYRCFAEDGDYFDPDAVELTVTASYEIQSGTSVLATTFFVLCQGCEQQITTVKTTDTPGTWEEITN